MLVRPSALLAAAVLLGGVVVAPSTTAAAAPSSAAAAVDVHPQFTEAGRRLVRLQAGAFDPLADDLPTVGDLPLVEDAPAAGPWLVQADGPLGLAAIADGLETLGIEQLGSLPDLTVLVWASPADAATLAGTPGVRWTGLLQPAWKIPAPVGDTPGLLDLEGSVTYRVRGFRGHPSADGLADALAAIDGVTVTRTATPVVEVEATSAQVPAIAALPAVQWVGVRPEGRTLNANARWVNDTGVPFMYGATAPGRLTGAGQTTAIADTGVNYVPDVNGNAHEAFRDCSAYPTDCDLADYTQKTPGDSPTALGEVVDNATDHRKVAAYFDLGGAGVNPPDDSSHGTHVSGSVTADYGGNGTWDGEDGMAPAARAVIQQIATPGGGLGGLPADDYDLWRQAYRPSNPNDVPESYDPTDYDKYVPTEDARTHNNSYGLVAPIVDEGSAAALDEFVWEHEDMTIVVSAGNSGPSGGSVGSPSVAKNNLTSGASANGRQPMVSIDSMASFSSHGPTGDLRFGVDLATPGQTVISTKGGSESDDHYLQGTSMSAPVLTGLATLVRQYFAEGYGPTSVDAASASASGFANGATTAASAHDPSAALVKATLVNGANRMEGYYTGDEGSERSADGQWPSGGQGFGLVNLDNSLFFTDDPANTWYRDVWRADGDAFAMGPAATRSYPIEVDPVADGESPTPLDVTLAWTDAPTAVPAGSPALVNNLDLVLTDPDGTTYVGNNMDTRANPDGAGQTLPGPTPTDTRNPVERVRVLEPAEGTWTIAVQSTGVLEGPQGFALAASGSISEADENATDFVAGPAVLSDAAGEPTIADDVIVEELSADTARITFTTDEPTTATATVMVDGAEQTFTDVYNAAPGGAFQQHYDTGTIETSETYAGRPAITTDHEILLFGLGAGTHDVTLAATDLGENTVTTPVTVDSPLTISQPLASDIGQLAQSDTDVIPSVILGGSGFQTGTQLYAGNSGGSGLLGAAMFRLPESLDPATVTGASVELSSMHVLSSLYTDDPHIDVDLLPESFEPNWGTQNYDEIHNADPVARAFPETQALVGGQQSHVFSFSCTDLDLLRETLATVEDGERRAAFRIDSAYRDSTSLPSYEFGFNRRSQGPHLRPRLVLHTSDTTTSNLRGPCDASTPAPTITDVEIGPGETDSSQVVYWRTDVASDSLVLVREVGTSEWTQVGSQEFTTVHAVQVRGLDPDAEYEFGVRSAACNGNTRTDDNAGAGYALFLTEPSGGSGTTTGPTTDVTSWDFDDGLQGWTVTDEGSGLITSNWEHNPNGGSDGDGAPEVMPYFSDSRTLLTAPGAVTIPDGEVAVQVAFDGYVDLEEDFDYLYLEFSVDDGGTWSAAGTYTGNDPSYEPRTAVLPDVKAGDEVLLRFVVESDPLLDSTTGSGSGAGVDDVVLQTVPAADDTGEGQDDDGRDTVPPHPAPSAEGTIDLSSVDTRAPTAADFAAGTAVCTDTTALPPRVDIGDAEVVEGDSEATLEFAVSLTEAADGPVTVRVRTVDGTATAPEDYTARATDVTFDPGTTQQVVEITVVGDDVVEDDETLQLRAVAADGALLRDAVGEGTILDDDADDTDGGADGDDGTGGSGGGDGSGDGSGSGDSGSDGDVGDAEVDVFTLAGDDRIATAVEVSRRTDLLTDAEFGRTVVLARSDLYPDALAGGPLAAEVGGPILLTPPTTLADRTREELERLETTRVLLLGGETALSSAVAQQLEGLGLDVERFAGADRFATAGLVAEELGGDTVMFVEGADDDPARGWPDAVSAGAYGATGGFPILLATTDALPAATADALDALAPDDVIIVGGPVAISSSLEQELTDRGESVRRLAGDTRYATTVEVAEAAARDLGASLDLPWFATGRNWPDALAAGPAVATSGGVLLLIDGQDVAGSPEVDDLIDERAATIEAVHFLGGDVAISPAVTAGVLVRLR